MILTDNASISLDVVQITETETLIFSEISHKDVISHEKETMSFFGLSLPSFSLQQQSGGEMLSKSAHDDTKKQASSSATLGMLFGDVSGHAPAPTPPADADESMTLGDQHAPSPAPHEPIYALDQLKHAGVPFRAQISPYLQMDPSVFRNSQPQYIMPEGAEHGKGKFEFALSHIGWAVGTGFAFGAVRGLSGELINAETKRLVSAGQGRRN